MAPRTGREVRLAARPKGRPLPGDFAVAEAETPALAEGQILLRTRWISVDPMMRIMIDEAPLGGGLPGLPVGTPIPGPAVSEVIETRHPDFKVGDMVEGRTGWREYAVSNGAGLVRVDTSLGDESLALGPLGLPGFTAYIGLQLCKPVEGKTILVSGAAGAVGSVLGPLAKAQGARLVGVASGEVRCKALLEQLSYDVALDRTQPDFAAKLAEAAPDGYDIYFDNVGGPMFGQVLRLMKRGGMVLICGLMSQYNHDEGGAGLSNALEAIMARGLTVRAYSNTEFPQLRPAFERDVGDMLRKGALVPRSQIAHGIDAVPDAFCRLFSEPVVGKSLVKLD